jgi:hypothetical protein
VKTFIAVILYNFIRFIMRPKCFKRKKSVVFVVTKIFLFLADVFKVFFKRVTKLSIVSHLRNN